MSIIFAGYNINQTKDGYVIKKNGVAVSTQPTEELALKWAGAEADKALHARYGKNPAAHEGSE
jgi:hypothetical protein